MQSYYPHVARAEHIKTVDSDFTGRLSSKRKRRTDPLDQAQPWVLRAVWTEQRRSETGVWSGGTLRGADLVLSGQGRVYDIFRKTLPKAYAEAGLGHDNDISRRHFSIGLAGGRVILRNHSPSFGTWLNGVKLDEEADSRPLVQGDTIRAGRTLFVLGRRPVREAEFYRGEGVGLLVGDSAAMARVRTLIRRYAGVSGASVLITGATGTGKDVAAHALHEEALEGKPFLGINCGAIPEERQEAELFGWCEGAFTDARADHPGYFRAAGDGLFFIDEIGEMSAAVQTKLLRALQEREVQPLGAKKAVPYEARIAVATNKDLDLEVEEGRFRADLLFRLAGKGFGLSVWMPPLSERREDIPLLLDALRADVRPARTHARLDVEVMERLLIRSWGGNVRELAKQLEALDASIDLDPEALGFCMHPAWLFAEPVERRASVGPTPSFAGELNKPNFADLYDEKKANMAAVARALGLAGGDSKESAVGRFGFSSSLAARQWVEDYRAESLQAELESTGPEVLRGRVGAAVCQIPILADGTLDLDHGTCDCRFYKRSPRCRHLLALAAADRS